MILFILLVKEIRKEAVLFPDNKDESGLAEVSNEVASAFFCPFF
jgi:hypothetical protein